MTARYKFTDSERKLLTFKVFPILFLGSVVWLFSQVFFNYIFVTQTIFTEEFFLVFYIVMFIVNGAFLGFFYLFSKWGNNFLGVLFYLLFAFTAGTIPVPLSMIIILDQVLKTYVNAFVSLVFGGTLIITIMGYVFRNNFLKKKYALAHILFLVISVTTLEILFLVIYDISNPVLIVVSTLVLTIAAIVVLFYGISLSSKIKEDYWIHMVFRIILSLLIVSIIFLIIVIIFVIAMIFQDDLALDGLFYPRSGVKTKKNKKKYFKELT